MASPSSDQNGCEEEEEEAKPQNLVACQSPTLLKDPHKHISRHGLRGEVLFQNLLNFTFSCFHVDFSCVLIRFVVGLFYFLLCANYLVRLSKGFSFSVWN